MATDAVQPRTTNQAVPGKVIAPAGPDWSSLNPSQKEALQPLAASWALLNEPQKRKWLAMSRNFSAMPAAEQATLHSRMREWAALSPPQRSLARLNYGETRQLPADEKKAKWEAYQALSPEEKRKLAATGPTPPVGAAPAVKPVPAQKRIQTPATPLVDPQSPLSKPAPPPQINRNTLLPNALVPSSPPATPGPPPSRP